MKTELLDHVEAGSLKKKTFRFDVGDIVDVHYLIREGNKTRIQIFNGTVISRSGRGVNEKFIVRRMVGEEGVERIFPIHSPSVVDVKALRSGKTRRAKLFFLRDRVGKGVRLKQRHSTHTLRK